MSENVIKETKDNFLLSKWEKIFGILLVVASVALAAWGIWGGLMLGYFVAIISVFVIASIYFGKFQKTKKLFPIFCGIVFILVSAVFVFTTNASVRFISIYISLMLLLGWFSVFMPDKQENGDLDIFFTLFRPLYELAFPFIPVTIKAIFSSPKKENKIFIKILTGVLIAIPVLLVVVPLLISSDEAFSGLADKAFEQILITIVKIAVGLLISLVLVPYCFAIKNKTLSEDKTIAVRGIDNIIIITFLSLLSVCYLSYLFSQLAYFFSAFSGFLPENYVFNESEYARRGFFEMCIIAAINLVIIFAVLIMSHKNDKNLMCVTSRILCTFIGVFTLIIICTALSKMVLYISELGMTVLRITTSAFMVFLAVVFITLILRLYISKIKVLQTALITAGIVLSILGIFNVNRVVAKYNYEAYQSNILEEIDVYTIYEMGDEGLPYLVLLAEDSNLKVAQEAKQNIRNHIRNGKYYDYEIEHKYYKDIYVLGNRKHNTIKEFNFSRNSAYKALDEYIEENPEILIKEKEY